MKRLSFIWALLIAAIPAVQSQITHTTQGNVDLQAETLLKKAAAKVNNTSACSFSVTMVNKDSNKKETARQTVKVLFSKGRYRVSAPDQVLYCDGKSVWHWNQKVGEVVVDKMTDSDDDLMNPAKLLTSYSKNYKPKFIRLTDDGTAIIDLTPKKSRSFYKLRLFITEKSGILQSMEIHNFDSSCGEYHLSNFKTGVKCSDSDFFFDATNNKGVEVIDMR